jgi:hypothetical protein
MKSRFLFPLIFLVFPTSVEGQVPRELETLFLSQCMDEGYGYLTPEEEQRLLVQGGPTGYRQEMRRRLQPCIDRKMENQGFDSSPRQTSGSNPSRSTSSRQTSNRTTVSDDLGRVLYEYRNPIVLGVIGLILIVGLGFPSRGSKRRRISIGGVPTVHSVTESTPNVVTSPQVTPRSRGVVQSLIQLTSMKNEGLITEEEFDSKKKELLDRL